MGLVVKTDNYPVTVFRQDKTSAAGKPYTTYCLGVSSRNMDGSYNNGFLNCRFKKDVDVLNKSKIKINNSFYQVNEYNNNTYLNLFITDFEVVEQGEGAKAPVDNDFMDIPEGVADDLPFA